MGEAKCPDCGAMNAADANFCDQCGSPLNSSTPYVATADDTVRCPSCNKMNEADAKFCDQCGQAMPAGRSLPADERDSLRVAVLELAGDGRTLEGKALPYGEFAEIKDRRGHYQETILDGAFTQAIASTRPKMFFEHGQDVRIGKTPIGSFRRVWEERNHGAPAGLFVNGQLFENHLVQPLIDAARAKELAAWSVHFQTPDDGSWEKWDRTKGWDVRTVNRAHLPEISLVNFGAYRTTVSIRSLDQLAGRSDVESDPGEQVGQVDDAAARLQATQIRDRIWRMRTRSIG